MNVLRQTEPVSKLPYQVQGCSSAYSWYLQMLKLCPRLVETDLFFNSQAELALTLESIKSSASTLRSVLMKGLRRTVESQNRIETWHDLVQVALSRSELRNVYQLNLANIAPRPSASATPLGTPRLTILVILEAPSQSNLLQLIPRDLSALRQLYLKTQTVRHLPPNLSPLLPRLTSDIQCISFETSSRFDRPPILTQFLHPSPSIPIIPLEHFSRFPHLLALKLRGFVGPSLQLLHQLSSSCPLLELIDFQESFWISSDPALVYSPTDLYFGTIFPEDSIITELGKLSGLREIDLGFLPTTDRAKFGKLEKSMEERSIRLTWAKCRIERVMCGCGSYHTDEDSD